MRLSALALALALAGSGCGGAARRPVDLAGAWPAAQPAAPDFAGIDRALTRRAVLQRQFQQVLEVNATLHTPAWRAAWAEREIAVRALPLPDADALRAEARAAAEGDYEVAMVVVTYEPEENDLDRGERSIWRVALIDDAGAETPAGQIVRDRRSRDVLKSEFPTYGDFAEVYVARFPRSAGVLHPGARKVELKLASTRGRVVVTWRAAQ